MIKLLIKNIEDYNYSLEDSNFNNYLINIEFYSCKPKIGDYIYLNKNLLEEKILNIGPLTSASGKDVIDGDEDLIILEHNQDRIYLKRLYG